MKEQRLTVRQRLVCDLLKSERAFFTTHWADEETADVVVEHNAATPEVDMMVFFEAQGEPMIAALIPHCLRSELCGPRREES